MGRGYLGGFGGGAGPGKGDSLGSTGAGGVTGGGGSYAEKVAVDHPDQLVFATAVVDLIF